MTVVADTAGVRGGFPGRCCGTSDGVLGGGLCDAGSLCCLLAGEAGEETGLAAGGGSGGCASASHDV